MYLQLSNEGIRKIQKITQDLILNINNLIDNSITQKLSHLKILSESCLDCNSIAENNYTKSSTYIKSTASYIAKKENAYKRAIRFKWLTTI